MQKYILPDKLEKNLNFLQALLIKIHFRRSNHLKVMNLQNQCHYHI
jgi:hypothetical protein